MFKTTNSMILEHCSLKTQINN